MIANKTTVLNTLSQHKQHLVDRFNIESIAVFGSVARHSNSAESDVDILVSYATPPGLIGFMDLKLYLESLLKLKVDLVTEDALKPALKNRILEEAVNVS